MMIEFADWLNATAFSEWIAHTPGVIQTLQTLHILALAAVLSATVMLDLRLLGVIGAEQTAARLRRRYLPPVWIGLGVLAVTGVILIAGEPFELLFNTTLRVKLALIVLAGGVTLALGAGMRPGLAIAELPPVRRRGLAAGAAVSLILWLLIALAGRFIAYLG